MRRYKWFIWISVFTILGLIFGLKQFGYWEKKTGPTLPVHQLSNHIYTICGDYGNMIVMKGPDGALLVDSKHASLVPALRQVFLQINLDPANIRFILNTHYHADHVGGNHILKSARTEIIAQQKTAERMRQALFNPFFEERSKPVPAEAMPNIRFKKKMTIRLNGERIALVHYPGHSDGDAIVFFHKANIIHLGDLYFNDIPPCADIVAGGTINGMIESLNRLLPLLDEKTIVVPGHGAISNKAGLVNYLRDLTTLRNAVQAGIDKGMSAKEIAATKPTAAFDKDWSYRWFNPDRCVEYTYLDLIRFKSTKRIK